MLTLEEQERRAYISGNVELAAALAYAYISGNVELAYADDSNADREDELRHEVEMLRAELADLEDELKELRT